MDVRSRWQTAKARKGKFQAESSGRIRGKQQSITDTKNKKNHLIIPEATEVRTTEHSGDHTPNRNIATGSTCTQQLDNLLIHYTVQEVKEITSSNVQVRAISPEGSGAEDSVLVTSIQLLPGLKTGQR